MKTTNYITTHKCKACQTHTQRTVTAEEFRAVQMHDAWPTSQPEVPGLKEVNGSICLPCRGCGKWLYARSVVGKVSTKHECGAKCMSSHGPSCECSCGGKNHGASWAAQ